MDAIIEHLETAQAISKRLRIVSNGNNLPLAIHYANHSTRLGVHFNFPVISGILAPPD
jgi:hypothetical protein